MRTLILASLLIPALLLANSPLWAENSTRAAGYTVHHNALPTALLAPQIAKQYQIVRSKYRGLLNISVIKDVPGTTGQPVRAQVDAYALNLIGRRHDIALREVQEGEAIYYIGDFPIVDGEQLNFTIEVIPEGRAQPIRTSLSEEFYVD